MPMTSSARTPCAIETTFSSSIPWSRAQARHWRATEPVESISTPSRSKRMAEQRKVVIPFFYHRRLRELSSWATKRSSGRKVISEAQVRGDQVASGKM